MKLEITNRRQAAIFSLMVRAVIYAEDYEAGPFLGLEDPQNFRDNRRPPQPREHWLKEYNAVADHFVAWHLTNLDSWMNQLNYDWELGDRSRCDQQEFQWARALFDQLVTMTGAPYNITQL